jgi:hypothetical protein
MMFYLRENGRELGTAKSSSPEIYEISANGR